MFYKIINKIKTHSLSKKKILIINLNKNEINFLKKLLKLNIIKYILKDNNKFVLILNFFKTNKLIFKLQNLFLPSNNKIIKLKNIKKINRKNKLILLTSNKGFINNYEAEKIKSGGIILLYIWS